MHIHFRNKHKKVNHTENLNKKFGRLTVLEIIKHTRYIKYKCACDCGKLTETYAQSVINKVTKSCGCIHKEYCNSIKKTPRKDIKKGINSSSANTVWLAYKRNALIRGHIMEFSKNELLQLAQKNCYYCGVEPIQIAKIKRKNIPEFKYNGVDRLLNDKGYTKENCVPCCFICNRAKGNMTKDTFEKWINILVKKRTKNESY